MSLATPSALGAAREAPDRLRWVKLLLVVFSTTVCYMVWSSPFPLLPLWKHDFGISQSQGGLLAALFTLPGFFVSIPVGWLLDRYPNAPTLSAAWLLAGAGVLAMALAPSFWILCAGRVILAIGMNAHHVGGPRLIAAWFRGSRLLGLAMSFYSWAITAGIFFGLTYLSRIAMLFGWRPALYLLAALSALALAAMWIAASGIRPDRDSAVGAAAPSLKFWRLGVPAWMAAIVYLFFNAGTDAYYTYSPSFLVTRGYDLARASAMVGFYAWFAFPLKPFFAIFLNRRTATPMVAVGSILAIAAYLQLASGFGSPYVASALLGIAVGLSMPAMFALPAYVLPGRLTGMGYGLVTLFMSCEMLTTPAVGYTVDSTHNYNLAYAVMSAYSLVALAGVIYLRKTMPRRPESDSGS